MARLVAVDWDGVEARYVVADARGDGLSIESAGVIPMPSESSAASSRSQLGALLKAAIGSKANRAKTLVSIDRSQVEVLMQTLPPASDVDLPEMVRNQAMRDNSAIGEDSLIDYLPLGNVPDQPRKVTAVALSNTRREQVDSIIDSAGLSIESITLRPYASAAFVLECQRDPDETCLLIQVLAEEVDLVVLSAGIPVFWRTLRQPGVSTDQTAAQKLLADIKRTMLLAQPYFPGQQIKSVCLTGGQGEHPALMEILARELSLPITLLDPFAAHGGPPEPLATPGRFVPLLGMMTTVARSRAHSIDFLHPRQRPAPPDRRRVLVLAGAAALITVLLGSYHAWSEFAAADDQIVALTSELDLLNDQLKQASQRQKVIAALETWTKSDVNWLDELRDLSVRFPSGRDAVVLRMGLSQGRDSGGTIDLVGIVRDPVVVSQIEGNLRDVHHQISSRHMQEQLQQNDYTWHFESTIGVVPRKAEEYVSHLDQAIDRQSTRELRLPQDRVGSATTQEPSP